MRPRILSLFCGAGLGELGIRPHFETVLALDSNWAACCSHIVNHPSVRVHHGDATNPAVIAEVARGVGPVQGIVATPACEPYSSAGAHRPDDRRAWGLLAIADWAEVLRPALLIIENVPFAQRSAHWVILGERLRFLGYRMVEWILDAADYGPPQHRRRLVAVCMRQGLPLPEPPEPCHGSGRLPYVTIGHVIGHLSEEEAMELGCASLSAGRAEIMAAVPPGQNWECLAGWRRERVLSSCRGKPHPKVCRRYAWHEVAATVLSGSNVRSTTAPLHPERNRPLSVVENLHLQGITRPFTVLGSKRLRYAQVGGGLPPQLASAVCGAVLKALDAGGREV